ncbi:hypothetical protein D3C86_667060 [compost metagenome]
MWSALLSSSCRAGCQSPPTCAVGNAAIACWYSAASASAWRCTSVGGGVCGTGVGTTISSPNAAARPSPTCSGQRRRGAVGALAVGARGVSAADDGIGGSCVAMAAHTRAGGTRSLGSARSRACSAAWSGSDGVMSS